MKKLYGAALKAHNKRLGHSSRRSFKTMKNGRPHSKSKITIPIAIVGGLLPGVKGVWDRRADPGAAMGFVAAAYTGVNIDTGKFYPQALKGGLLPLGIGVIIHKIAGMAGINRAIAGAGIPYLRI